MSTTRRRSVLDDDGSRSLVSVIYLLIRVCDVAFRVQVTVGWEFLAQCRALIKRGDRLLVAYKPTYRILYRILNHACL